MKPYEVKLKELNDKRIEYQQIQNAVAYYKSCNDLGIEPEDTFLYERGLTDIIMGDSK